MDLNFLRIVKKTLFAIENISLVRAVRGTTGKAEDKWKPHPPFDGSFHADTKTPIQMKIDFPFISIVVGCSVLIIINFAIYLISNMVSILCLCL